MFHGAICKDKDISIRINERVLEIRQKVGDAFPHPLVPSRRTCRNGGVPLNVPRDPKIQFDQQTWPEVHDHQTHFGHVLCVPNFAGLRDVVHIDVEPHDGLRMLDFGQFDFGQFDFGQLAEIELAELEIGRSRN